VTTVVHVLTGIRAREGETWSDLREQWFLNRSWDRFEQILGSVHIIVALMSGRQLATCRQHGHMFPCRMALTCFLVMAVMSVVFMFVVPM